MHTSITRNPSTQLDPSSSPACRELRQRASGRRAKHFRTYGRPGRSDIWPQSALESNWGRTVIGNAYFGVKGKSSSGNSTRFTTHEETRSGQRVSQVDEFRAFANHAEAAEDYASLIQRRYSGAMACKADPLKFAEAVARRHYATDVAYEAKLKSVLRLHVILLMGQQVAPASEPAAEHATP